MTKKQKKQNLQGNKGACNLRERSRKSQRGQILIIVVFSIIGLVAFVGLVVDTGLVFIGNGKLRRATDAAALAAAAEYRKDPSGAALTKDIKEYLTLNGVDEGTATVTLVCEQSPLPIECSPAKRRLVRVDASSTVKLAFLPVLGIRDVTLNATATSEAAALDIVLLMDVSESMTFKNVFYSVPDGTNESLNEMADPIECNVADLDHYTQCEPFNDIQKAAVQFVIDRFPDDGSNQFDRVAVIPFDRKAHAVYSAGDYNNPLHLSAQASYTSIQYVTVIKNAIKNLRVFTGSGSVDSGGPFSDGTCLNASGALQWTGTVPCRYYPPNGDGYCFSNESGYENTPISQVVTPDNLVANDSIFNDHRCFLQDGAGPYATLDGTTHYQRAYDFLQCDSTLTDVESFCGTTATGDALRAAGNEFILPAGFRQQSLWIVILLTDGVANHAEGDAYCPHADASALCQDGLTGLPSGVKTPSEGTRHCKHEGDPIYQNNDFLYKFCMTASVDYGGGGVENDNLYDEDDYARDMADFVSLGQNALIYTIGFGDEVTAHNDSGHQLLNYAADVGDDAKINTAAGVNNSDYFPAPTVNDLKKIFKTINDRISTRITQ